jgi:hypothetical protein
MSLSRGHEVDTPAPPRRRLGLVADLAAVALLLWAALAFWQEVAAAARGRERHPDLYPASWLLGGPQVEPLRLTLEALGHRLPRGAVVAVDSQAWGHDQLHFLTMWCAYYLPRHHVVHRELLADAPPPVYVITLPPRPDTPPGAIAIELPPGAPTPPVLSVHRLDATAPPGS